MKRHAADPTSIRRFITSVRTMASVDPLTPTQTWQALVPELCSLGLKGSSTPADSAADTAERLLLLLHYSIDWNTSWIAEPKRRKTYWDDLLPSRVRRAAYQCATLDEWWSAITRLLDISNPGQPQRRLELAALLREPALPVLNALQTSLPALLLRVRIITEAVSEHRKASQS